MTDEKKADVQGTVTPNQPCPDPKDCAADPKNCTRDPGECLSASKALNTGDGENMDECLGRSLDQLSRAFTASARRWEMVVYPALFAFVLLAAYGFFLIFSLTKDVSVVAGEMTQITKSMQQISVQMNAISKNIVLMTQTVDSQSVSMKEMVHHMRGMNVSMNQMRYDFSLLNNSVSRPMSFMNSFMPW